MLGCGVGVGFALFLVFVVWEKNPPTSTKERRDGWEWKSMPTRERWHYTLFLSLHGPTPNYYHMNTSPPNYYHITLTLGGPTFHLGFWVSLHPSFLCPSKIKNNKIRLQAHTLLQLGFFFDKNGFGGITSLWETLRFY